MLQIHHSFNKIFLCIWLRFCIHEFYFVVEWLLLSNYHSQTSVIIMCLDNDCQIDGLGKFWKTKTWNLQWVNFGLFQNFCIWHLLEAKISNLVKKETVQNFFWKRIVLIWVTVDDSGHMSRDQNHEQSTNNELEARLPWRIRMHPVPTADHIGGRTLLLVAALWICCWGGWLYKLILNKQKWNTLLC